MEEKDKIYKVAEQARQKAISDRDLDAYIGACTQLGVEPEPEVCQALEGPGINFQDHRKLMDKIDRRRNYSALLNYHRARSIDSEQPETRDSELMRRGLVKIMGYKTLRTGRGRQSIPIGQASPSRVREVYIRCLRQAKKHQ